MIDVHGNIKLIDFGLTHWRTKKIELTPEFAAPSVLSGEKPSLESDLISLNRIFHEFNFTHFKPLTHVPKSLLEKILILQNLGSPKTKGLKLMKPKKHPINSSLKKILSTITCCFIVSPIPAKNNVLIEHKVLVRSTKWLSIKAHKKDPWCFTPCSLKFKRTGLQTIHWKTQTKAKAITVYIDKNQKLLTLDSMNAL